uniref:Uncharacterized protein n=1 Tax=viral metagenome TaxID=1070528 RepID=A0A6M3JYV6_9ZZZZ
MKNKLSVGVRYLKKYDIERDFDYHRLDFLLLRILREGPKYIEGEAVKQFHFSFVESVNTPRNIAKCLRSLAYKIQHGIEKI